MGGATLGWPTWLSSQDPRWPRPRRPSWDRTLGRDERREGAQGSFYSWPMPRWQSSAVPSSSSEEGGGRGFLPARGRPRGLSPRRCRRRWPWRRRRRRPCRAAPSSERRLAGGGGRGLGGGCSRDGPAPSVKNRVALPPSRFYIARC